MPRVCAEAISYGDLRSYWEGRDPSNSWEVDQLVRSFLLYMFWCTLFTDTTCCMDLCLLLLYETLAPFRSGIGGLLPWLPFIKAWIGAVAVTFTFKGMAFWSRFVFSFVVSHSFSDSYPFNRPLCFLLQVWAYEHCVLERPFPISQEEVLYHALSRWGSRRYLMKWVHIELA